jgi:hypothetical protein
MRKFSINIRSILLGLLFLLLLLPMVQGKYKMFKLNWLQGAIEKVEPAEFSLPNWFEGTYQENTEKYLNNNYGFRSFFIRLHNQIAFSLFDEVNANSVIVGKERYLYEYHYIKAYNGLMNTRKRNIQLAVHRLEYLQDTLQKLDKTLILMIAPSKGRFFPEYFPEEYANQGAFNNYDMFKQALDSSQVNLIDFSDYFVSMKGKSKYPLFPQFGIHWSDYASSMATDSFLQYIESIRQIDLPDRIQTGFAMAQPKGTDYDIGGGLNLFFQLPSYEMAYPVNEYQSDSGKTKPNLLAISDSFYWGIYGYELGKAFTKCHFWYYNWQVFPENDFISTTTSDIDLKEEIAGHDIILIMANDASLYPLGWGFLDQAYAALGGFDRGDPLDMAYQKNLEEKKQSISADSNWMKNIRQKAKDNAISVDSALTMDAIYILDQVED